MLFAYSSKAFLIFLLAYVLFLFQIIKLSHFYLLFIDLNLYHLNPISYCLVPSVIMQT